ncbi:hypothetical protein [Shewanella baltica]|uniref:hypothetical protein n=1 Tax=Shewanella baltica TaxID=62322 RepID=UPI00167F9DF6|nr:hypothetical protein [Shewanella baltica]
MAKLSDEGAKKPTVFCPILVPCQLKYCAYPKHNKINQHIDINPDSNKDGLTGSLLNRVLITSKILVKPITGKLIIVSITLKLGSAKNKDQAVDSPFSDCSSFNAVY